MSPSVVPVIVSSEGVGIVIGSPPVTGMYLVRKIPPLSSSVKYTREPSVTTQHFFFPSFVSCLDLSTRGCGGGSMSQIPKASARQKIDPAAITAMRQRLPIRGALSTTALLSSDGIGCATALFSPPPSIAAVKR